MSEKPSKVEVGQRWRIGANIVGEILRSGSPCLTRWTAPDGRKWETEGWSDAQFLAQATYLGGPSTAPIAPPPQREKPTRVEVGQRWRADAPYTVTGLRNINGIPVCDLRMDEGRTHTWMPSMVLSDDYLGSPFSETPSAALPPFLLDEVANFGEAEYRLASAAMSKMKSVRQGLGPWPPKELTGDISAPYRRKDGEGAFSAVCHTCRLGDACPHSKPARQPYIPAVDEWDLLPDAGR